MASLPSRRRFVLGIAAGLSASPVWSVSDTSPLKLIVPTPPGSISDVLARAMSEPWAKHSGRTVVVENVAGAGSLVGTIQLARAPKDGLTVGLISSNHSINPWIFKNVPFDPISDFTPIAMIGNAPVVLVAASSIAANTPAELVQLAKTRSAPLAEGLVPGSAYQIASEVFKEQAGISTNRIFYKGTAQITNDLLAGIVDVAFISVQLAAPHIAAGKLKGLAVNTPVRAEIAPTIPTFVECGFARYNVDVWTGIAGPGGMTAESVAARRSELELVLADPQMRKALQAQGIQINPMSQADMARFIRADLERNRQLIERIGIKVD